MARREPVIPRLDAQAFAERVSRMPLRRDIVGVATMNRATTSPRRKPKPGTAGPRSTGRLQRAIDATVAREIKTALAEAGGVITDAARLLGISRIALRARMNALGIRG